MAYQDYESLKHKRQLKSELIEHSVMRVPTVYRAVVVLSILSSMVILLLLLAAFVPIYEIFPASGNLSPISDVKIIQHEDGGQIKDVLVKEGDIVKKGDLLVTFDDTGAKYEMLLARDKIIRLRMDIARLQAFLDDHSFELQDILNISPEINEENYHNYEDIINNVLYYKQKQQESLKTSKEELVTTIAKLEQELIADEKNIKNLFEQVILAKEKSKMYSELLDVAISRVAYLDAKKNYSRLESNLSDKLKQQAATKNDIEKNKFMLENLIANAKKDAHEEKNRLEATLLITKNTLERQQDILSRVKVIAPVDGAVSGLSVAIGGVVQRGTKILDLVPINEPLVARVEVRPEDISYINIGSPAQVHIDAFDYKFFGFIDGSVTDVASASIMKEDGTVVYTATVALNKNHISDGKNKKYLQPGMTVDAHIITGQKTFFKYMLKPVKSLFEDTSLDVQKYKKERMMKANQVIYSEDTMSAL